MREKVERHFRQIFVSEGYTEQIPFPIFPCPDQTTLFTCATISVFKEQLLAGSVGKMSVIQPCLRTQNVGRILDDSFDPEYLSSFLMLGIISPIKGFDINSVVNFFDSFPDSREKILVRNSKGIDDDFFRQLNRYYQTEFDTREPYYYRWQYGEKLLSGSGVTFALKQPDGRSLDIGNLVLIYKDGASVAVEFGFGLETLVSRLIGRGSPYEISREYLQTTLDLTPNKKRLGDSLIVALKLFENGITPGKGGAASVMRKAIRHACFLAIRDFGNLAIEKIPSLASTISLDPSWLEVVKKTFNMVRESVESFDHEVNHIKKHTSGVHLEKKIREYRNRYFIPEQY